MVVTVALIAFTLVCRLFSRAVNGTVALLLMMACMLARSVGVRVVVEAGVEAIVNVTAVLVPVAAGLSSTLLTPPRYEY